MQELASEMQTELTQFRNYINQLHCQCMEKEAGPAKQWVEGPASHNGIVARLVLFQQPQSGSGPATDTGEHQEDEDVVMEGQTLQFVNDRLPSVNI